MRKYGLLLLSLIPEETTELLMKLCTSYLSTDQKIAAEEVKQGKKAANPDQFIHIFVNQPEWLIKFLEHIFKNGKGTPAIHNLLLELYLRDDEDVLSFLISVLILIRNHQH